MPETKKHNTIFDIARELDISPSTVSRALSGSTLVKEKTKKRILQEAEKLHYIPNLAAKSLALGTSNTIGLLLSDMSPVNNMFASLFSRATLKSGMRPIVYNASNSFETQEYYLKDMVYRRVTAIVVSPVPGDYSVLKYAIDAEIPVVVINRFVRDFELDHVLFDPRKGICEAVDSLVETKKKSHFFQMAPKDVYEGIERRKSFEFALKAHDLMPEYNPVYPAEDRASSGYKVMNKILQSHENIDAVICCSDLTALGAIRAIQDKKLRIPEDISVVGFYNTSLSDYSNPRISSIDINLKEYVQQAVQKALEVGIKDRISKPEIINLPTNYIAKESS